MPSIPSTPVPPDFKIGQAVIINRKDHADHGELFYVKEISSNLKGYVMVHIPGCAPRTFFHEWLDIVHFGA